MALTPVSFQKKPKSGGGGIGSVIGGTLGAIGGFVAGGPAGAAAGFSAGSAAGGMVGGMAAPGKSGGQGLQLNQSAMSRRMTANTPQPAEDHSKILEQSLVALQDTNPEIAKAYGPPLLSAYEQALGSRGRA